MKYFFQKYRYPVLFVIVFSAICLFYNFLEIIQYPPMSIHQWRQTDSASTALNYYQDGLNFFKPRMHYVMGGEGYVTGAGEAPIFYYFVALLYKIFGPQDWIFRLLSLITFLSGLFFLSKVILEQSKDLFVAISIPAIIMGSPVIAFYSANFTPNIPAQGIAMVGIWFFYLFYTKSQLKFFYWSMFFFALAGLIKVSALLSFFVIVGLWLVEAVNVSKFKNGEKLFNAPLKIIPAFLVVMTIIFGWKLFADNYNEIHQVNYFLSKIRPIWSVDEGARELIWNNIIEKRLPSYFHPYTLWAFAGLGLFILFTPRKHAPVLYFSFLFYTLGCLSFFLLMFKQFEHHDYYAIEMMLLPLIILSLFAFYLKKNWPSIFKKWWFKLILAAFLVFNIYHTKTHLELRYDPNGIYMSHFNPSFYKKVELQQFIKDLGITLTDKVISAPDQSPNSTLYYLNLRGWSEYFMGGPLNPLVMEYFISSSAQYLIINDANYLEMEELKPFLKYPMGTFKSSIFVFDIRPYKLKDIEIYGVK
jgi:hypothetical protein